MARLVVLLIAAVSAMFMLYKCSNERIDAFAPDDRKSGGDTLDIAIELSPICYSLDGDTISGVDYDIICGISEKHSVPVKFHPFVPLGYALDGLRQGRFDVVVASLPLTMELREQFLMTDPVYLDKEVLVQHKDKISGMPRVLSQEQLAGDTVWISAGSPFQTRLRNLSREIGDTIYIKSSDEYSAEYLFILVALGKIRQAVVNDGVARRMVKDYPDVDISIDISFTQFQSWALNKGSEALRDSINRWLKDR